MSTIEAELVHLLHRDRVLPHYICAYITKFRDIYLSIIHIGNVETTCLHLAVSRVSEIMHYCCFFVVRILRGFAKLKKFKKSKKNLDRAQPTHPPTHPPIQIYIFWKPISDMARTLKSQLLITYRHNTSHYAHTT